MKSMINEYKNRIKMSVKKNITTIFVLLAVFTANAQISIGGKQSVDGAATILDFNDVATNTMGIILPSVDNLTNSLASTPANNNGTFLFDKSAGKVKMYENNAWVDLSSAGNASQIVANGSNESASNQGAIIGSETSDAKGVLVLESANKAMILPKIANPHINVKSPYPGMMCYDTVSKSLALFDGSVWNYWK